MNAGTLELINALLTVIESQIPNLTAELQKGTITKAQQQDVYNQMQAIANKTVFAGPEWQQSDTNPSGQG